MLKLIPARLNNVAHIEKLMVKKISLAAVRKEPIVTVKQGRLLGAMDSLYDGSSFYSFKGIPFAQPPVGPLRFRGPLPPARWHGIRDATKHGHVCIQHGVGARSTFEGNEDCLFINVYTKSLAPSSKIPVMVCIHGGGYFCGSGNDDFHGPKFLLQHDVVLVTFNYRLEVLGFLSLDIPEAPGNAGMKDQVAALKWVQNNISQFGGDPDNVTLFGESAGASCVMKHMQSPMSQGLFHKAITQSGTCIHDWSIGRDSKMRAFRVGQCLGNNTTNTTELLEFLKNVPASKLTHLTAKTTTHDEKHRCLPMHFCPVVEKKFDSVEPFLDEEPMDILLSKKMSSIPLLIGYNSAEGIAFIGNKLKKLDFLNKNASYNVPREIAYKVTQEQMTEMGERIKKFYVGDRDLREEDLEEIAAMLTDFHYVYNTHRFAHLYSQHYNSPIFMYRFSFETDLNFYKIQLGFDVNYVKGACHADDLFYLFSSNANKDAYELQDELRYYVWNVTKLWTNFAKTSNPTPDNGLGVTWPRYTTGGKEFLEINKTMTPGKYAERERVQFWDTLYKEAGLPCIH